MSNRACVTALCLVLGLTGCAPSESEGRSQTPVLRIVCGLQRWLERNDFRVREEGVDRCAGAVRQLEASGERAKALLEKRLDPDREEDEPAPRQGEGS